MAADHTDPTPKGELRASHADRDGVVEQLRDAAAEGRLDMDELDARLGQALTAKTLAELEPLVADLPRAAVSPEPAEPLVLKAGAYGVTRAGRWRVPARITVHGGMGGAKLDFTQVECWLPEIGVEAHGDMGGVTIVVPADWAVETDGVDPGLAGVKDRTTPDRLPGTPLIRLSGDGGMGGMTVRHPSRGELRKLRRAQRG